MSSASPLEVVKAAHSEGTSDEFLEPVRFAPELIEANDALVLFNFRPDRMRQLTAAFVNSNFQGFERQLISPLPVVTFTQYDKTLPVAVAFPPESLDDLLGEVVARAGLRQFRTAETEKYPHVTYFLNGGMEKPFPGKTVTWCPPPRWPPTTSHRTCRPMSSPTAVWRHQEGDLFAGGDQLRQPRHGGPHR